MKMVRMEQVVLSILLILSMYTNACMASDCGNVVVSTINVGLNGKKKFRSIQKAIDSIRPGNNKWIRIFISKGRYKERVEIPKDKGCIYIEGEKEGQTIIAMGNHGSVATSATFTAYSDNIAVKNMVFQNSYIIAEDSNGPVEQAVAVRLQGDKYSFFKCKFIGIQDTIWDALGRHYFKQCHIVGVIDFIWGSGQSIYEGCVLDVTLDSLRDKDKHIGTITAQGRNSESETNGFVFKQCVIKGDKMLLGRAYRPYSRVIFYQSQIPKTIIPQGWDAWNSKGHENKITYEEFQNKGPGADTSKRVSWLKKMSKDQLNRFINLRYIDHEGWIPKLPRGAIV